MILLTPSLVHTEPCGRSPAINMIPAPLMPVSSTHTEHRCLVATSGASRRSWATIRRRRSPATAHRRLHTITRLAPSNCHRSPPDPSRSFVKWAGIHAIPNGRAIRDYASCV
jgi:hypothetical protein